MIKIPVLKNDKISEYFESINYNILAFGCWEQKANNQIFNDVTGHFKFIYFLKGECTVIVNGTEYQIQSGDIILYAPFTTYQAICANNKKQIKFYYLHFDIDSIEQKNLLKKQLYLKNISVYKNLMSNPFIGNVDSIYQHTKTYQFACYYNVTNLLRTSIMAILHTIPFETTYELITQITITNKEKIIRECVSYLNSNMHQSISVQALCDHTNVSQSYLYKCFSSVLNISIKDFIMEHKLRHLTINLLKENHSLKELAYNYGFSSVNHLSTVFKKYYGCAPTIYQKKFLDS